MNHNAHFWQNKSVFLTGHTGFKGGWLSLWLQEMGAKVTGFALPPNTSPNLFTSARVGENIRSTLGDIRDLPSLQNTINQAKPEIVFHLAAQPLVRESYINPVDTYATNVMGTVNVLEAIRQHNLHGGKIKAVVNITTDKCYENKEWLWGYREDEPMGGFDPYSNSKGCSELITSAYRRSFFADINVALASARAGNVIGGGDWSMDRLIPDFIRAIEMKKPLILRYPHATRPWQFVLEPLSGYLMLAERLYTEGQTFAEGWNFGPDEGDNQSVAQVVAQFAKSWGNEAKWQIDPTAQPHEAGFLKLDCAKAKTKLGWHPRWNLATALAHTADWYQASLTGNDVREKCLAQINLFCKN